MVIGDVLWTDGFMQEHYLHQVPPSFYKQTSPRINLTLRWTRQAPRHSVDYNDKDISRVFNYEEDINALTKEEVRKVAKKYLSDGYILCIHNPEN